jgi:hypothetical protein
MGFGDLHSVDFLPPDQSEARARSIAEQIVRSIDARVEPPRRFHVESVEGENSCDRAAPSDFAGAT